ncbi:alginate lyase family protein [Flavobacterium nackdongense]|uniref:Alginate lyase n=1 Tax=Flavobacterium nackdongense TaxID=2547394 RepID=A0A4P6Y9Y1_9FLAO|nr:alginate lyase family protein [Flavobacterium nackdongense]QBN17435.1 alginate lyase [Flavobacterium nackdongense]
MLKRKQIGILVVIGITFIGCSSAKMALDLNAIEKPRVLKKAELYFNAEPITVTSSFCSRSAGTIHDFYSEGDYWWPDPQNSTGPYIRKDGMTNPNNFTAHREAMIRLSQISGALGSAYILTKDKKYADQLAIHLRAWFINENTKMNPNLLYAQAIKGVATGRGIGIIDTIHLIEVVKAIQAIEDSRSLSATELATIKLWFSSYLKWMTTHEYGIAERDNGNNHSVCWALQVAAFASLTNDTETMNFCRNFYKNTLLPNQMAKDGSFPLELQRTKPYGYSLFNLDAMASICQILSTKEDNLFAYTTKDKQNIALGLQFMVPYIENKSLWPYPKDVMYWDEWPVRQSSLLFGGLALKKDKYIDLWKSLNGDFTNPEVIRNMPVRYPILWLIK